MEAAAHVAPPVPAARAHRRDGARVPAGVPGYVSKHQQAAWVAAALAEVRTRGRGGGCSTVSPPHGPREDGLTHPADTSRSNHAAVLGVLLRWRLGKPWVENAECRHRTGRERMDSPTLQTLQDPIMLTPLGVLRAAFQTLSRVHHS